MSYLGQKNQKKAAKKISSINDLGRVREWTEGLQYSRGYRPWGVCRRTDREGEGMHGEDGAHAELVVHHLLLRQSQEKFSQKHLAMCWGCQSSVSKVLICLPHPSDSCDASELIWGVRNFIWLTAFRASCWQYATVKHWRQQIIMTGTDPNALRRWQTQPFFFSLEEFIIVMFVWVLQQQQAKYFAA